MDPTKREIHRDAHNANDPDTLAVFLALDAEDDGVDDTAEVAGGAGDAGHDA